MISKRYIKAVLITAGVIMTSVLISPLPKFNVPYSTVVEANDGSLLGARIADDGQWRFPATEIIPEKFEKSLLTFEDRWFYYHPGINPVAVWKAMAGNIRAGKIVSGGSTITMQVARISRGNRERTYREKTFEMLSAIKLEIFRSKKRIFFMYAANAPYGGNTVGLEAAAWRYTGKSPADLTWAEAATLAILPNAPSLVFPGRNQQLLKNKRDKLLKRLHGRGYFDSTTLELAIDEPVLGQPKQLPVKAPHLTDYFYKNNQQSSERACSQLYIQLGGNNHRSKNRECSRIRRQQHPGRVRETRRRCRHNPIGAKHGKHFEANSLCCNAEVGRSASEHTYCRYPDKIPGILAKEFRQKLQRRGDSK